MQQDSVDTVWYGKQLEARLFDVPFILDASSVKSINDEVIPLDRVTGIGYETQLSKSEVIAFYRKEMECSCWRELMLFEGIQEAILNFEKPTKYCSILVRSLKKGTMVTIFIDSKN